MPYSEDSLFTLSAAGQLIVVSISLVLAILFFAACYKLSRGRGLLLGAAIGCALFALFDWLTPQVYYTYYLTYFDTLEPQIVINPWPDVAGLFRLLSFTDNANLSFHSRGVLGWLLIIVGLVSGRSKAP